jgi:hypothetical protein
LTLGEHAPVSKAARPSPTVSSANTATSSPVLIDITNSVAIGPSCSKVSRRSHSDQMYDRFNSLPDNATVYDVFNDPLLASFLCQSQSSISEYNELIRVSPHSSHSDSILASSFSLSPVASSLDNSKLSPIHWSSHLLSRPSNASSSSLPSIHLPNGSPNQSSNASSSSLPSIHLPNGSPNQSSNASSSLPSIHLPNASPNQSSNASSSLPSIHLPNASPKQSSNAPSIHLPPLSHHASSSSSSGLPELVSRNVSYGFSSFGSNVYPPSSPYVMQPPWYLQVSSSTASNATSNDASSLSSSQSIWSVVDDVINNDI